MEKKSITAKIASLVLQEILNHTDKLESKENEFSLFYARSKPSISIKKYMDRIAKYSQCSESVFVLSLIYLDRVIESHSGFLLTSFNIHRLLMSSFILAVKFLDDVYFDNSFYAKIGGIGHEEMNKLEMEFAVLMDFNFYTTEANFKEYFIQLYRHYKSGIEKASEEPAVGSPRQNGRSSGSETQQMAASWPRIEEEEESHMQNC